MVQPGVIATLAMSPVGEGREGYRQTHRDGKSCSGKHHSRSHPLPLQRRVKLHCIPALMVPVAPLILILCRDAIFRFNSPLSMTAARWASGSTTPAFLSLANGHDRRVGLLVRKGYRDLENRLKVVRDAKRCKGRDRLDLNRRIAVLERQLHGFIEALSGNAAPRIGALRAPSTRERTLSGPEASSRSRPPESRPPAGADPRCVSGLPIPPSRSRTAPRGSLRRRSA